MTKAFASSQRAFPVLPNTDRYFASESSENARTRLSMTIERGDGPALLIGAAGCGKSMILEVIAQQFRSTFRVARISSTTLCTRRALLQAILHGLDLPYKVQDEGRLRFALSDALGNLPPVLLLVDEAQSLPTRLLEELRMLTNRSNEGTPGLLLILAGTNALDEKFTLPELEAFSQRLSSRCYMSPLNREETAQYVRAHIAAAGEDPDQLVDDSVYRNLFTATEGIPRLINQLCDRALIMAIEAGQKRIDSAVLQAAWSDLHQLPAPWYSPESEELAKVGIEELTTAPSFDEALQEFGSAAEIETIQESTPEVAKKCCSSSGEPCTHSCRVPNFNADQALVDLELNKQNTAEEDPCITYAFPKKDSAIAEPAELNVPKELATEPVGFELIRPLINNSFDESLFEETPLQHASCEQNDSSVNPFEEAFDEEEVVLDRCMSVDELINDSLPQVSNCQEINFGNMFGALSPAVESLLDEVTQQIDQYNNAIGLNVYGLSTDDTSNDPITDDYELDTEELEVSDLHSTVSTFEGLNSTTDSEILIVEENERPIASPEVATAEVDVESGVHRLEYRQLFANLRQG